MDYLLKEIEVFVKIAERGSFRAAGDDLHLTQSAMTQRLKKLEAALGVRLLDRTTRHVAPTAIGQNFLPIARRMLMQFEQSMSDLTDLIEARTGQVNLASLISVATCVLPRILKSFGHDHPNVGVRVIDDAERQIAAHVLRGDADFGIDMQTDDPRPDLIETPLAKDRYVVICRPEHPLASQRYVAWDALAESPLILLGARSGTNRLMPRQLAGAPLASRWRYQVQHLSTLIGMVAEGVGVGIAPALALDNRQGGELARVRLVNPDLTRTIVLVERHDVELSPAASLLRNALLSAFKILDDGNTRAPE